LANIFSCSNCHCWSLQPLIRKNVNGSSIRFLPVHLQFNTLINYKQRENLKNGSEKQEITELNLKDPICSFCGSIAIHFGGPIYVSPIHDPVFVNRMLNKYSFLIKKFYFCFTLNFSLKQENNLQQFGTIKRLIGVLTLVLEELHDQPLFYEFEQLMSVIKCAATPKNTLVRSALLNAGFRCSGSHCGPQALKTDAPAEFLWDICREWVNINLYFLILKCLGSKI
jgi:tRNA G26 N,N-dimethylase Trm1